jgi:TRAP-type C4-dicarboxylate transport system substrate-binding protein
MYLLRAKNRWCILGLLLFVIGYADAKTVWKMATVAPENSPWLDFWFKGVSAIEKRAPEFHIITYTSLPENKVVEGFKKDEYHVAVITSEGTYLLIPELMVFSVPGLIMDDDEIDRVRDSFIKRVEDTGEKKGYKVLAWFDQGFEYLVSNFEVSSVEDFKKLKVGVWSSDPLISSLFSKLGAKVIYKDAWQILDAFKKGEINATYCAPLVCVVTQSFTQVKFILNFKIRYEPAFIVTKLSTWNSISPDTREVIVDELNSRVPAVIKLTRWYHVRAFEGLLKEGIKQVQPKEDLKAFIESIDMEEYIKVTPPISKSDILYIRKITGR